MKNFSYLIAMTCMVVSCSTLDKLKFWGGDSEQHAEEGSSAESKADDATASAEDGDNAAHKEASPDASKKDTGSKKSVKNMTMEDMELKQAKLWARVDALEEQASRQRERMRVIEKGLMLGLIPEELKDDAKPKSKAVHANHDVSAKAHSSSKDKSKAEKSPAPVAVAAAAEKSGEVSPAFEERMAAAQDFFRAGRYGRAIAEYSSIGKEFKQLDRNGSHQFWIALSWLNLKEMNAAQQNFESFLTEYPGSPWAVRAHFYLARVETQMGMREKSLQRLRRIISEFPNEDVAEMAKMEISNMGKTL